MSTDDDIKARLVPHLSRETCREHLVALVRVPSPQTALLEAEPALRRFIEAAVAPRIQALGADMCRTDGIGNLIAAFGGGEGPSLMFLAHAMNHPPTTMPDPYGGQVLDGTPFGVPGEVVRGRGASEQKGTLAAMLHALEALVASRLPLVGRLHFVCCVSGETGKVDAIRNVVEVEGVRPGHRCRLRQRPEAAIGQPRPHRHADRRQRPPVPQQSPPGGLQRDHRRAGRRTAALGARSRSNASIPISGAPP